MGRCCGTATLAADQPIDMSRHTHRATTRTNLRRPLRKLNRASLRGRRSGPDDFAQMLTAMGRAVRAHRKLARLAPSFFDAAVVNRERENRVEKLKWMAMWEPIIAKAYGVPPEPPDLAADLPRLPHPNTQRAVDRQLAELQLWLAAADAAGGRHRQRQPHALPSLTRLARLLQLAFDLKKMVLGLDSKNPLPDKITYDYEFTDLKRAYGHLGDAGPPTVVASPAVTATPSSPPPTPAESPVAPPPASLGSHHVPDQAILAVADPSPPAPPRCDAWSRMARQLRK